MRKLILLLGVIILSGWGLSSWGHDVDVEMEIESVTIRVRAVYADGKPIVSGTWKIQDASGNIVSQGIPDPMGGFRIQYNLTGDAKLIVDDDMGHREEFELSDHTLEHVLAGEELHHHEESGEAAHSHDDQAGLEEARQIEQEVKKAEVDRHQKEMEARARSNSLRSVLAILAVALIVIIFFFVQRKTIQH